MIYQQFDSYRKAPHPFGEYGNQPPTSLINRYIPSNYSSIPQGDKHISKIEKKHYEYNNISKVVKENAFNSDMLNKQKQKNPQLEYSRNKHYQRNMDTIDIEGAHGDSLKSQAVRYQLKAKQERSKHANGKNKNAEYDMIQSEIKQYQNNIQKGLKIYQKDKQLGKFISYKGNGYLNKLPGHSQQNIARMRELQQRNRKPINPSLLSHNVKDMFLYQKTAQIRNKYNQYPQLTQAEQKHNNSHKYNQSLNSNNLNDVFTTIQKQKYKQKQKQFSSRLQQSRSKQKYNQNQKSEKLRYWQRQKNLNSLIRSQIIQDKAYQNAKKNQYENSPKLGNQNQNNREMQKRSNVDKDKRLWKNAPNDILDQNSYQTLDDQKNKKGNKISRSHDYTYNNSSINNYRDGQQYEPQSPQLPARYNCQQKSGRQWQTNNNQNYNYPQNQIEHKHEYEPRYQNKAQLEQQNRAFVPYQNTQQCQRTKGKVLKRNLHVSDQLSQFLK